MEFITQNFTNILAIIGALYPPLLFLLPKEKANKIDLGIKAIKTIVTVLENARDTKGGFSLEDDTKKQFYQKPKN